MKELFSVPSQLVSTYSGTISEAFDFVSRAQLLRPDLWHRFVDQFRTPSDADEGWRGEYWGKMMRGACLVYAYSRDEELYALLSDTVREMIGCADNSGRISSYPAEHELCSWDVWCRKYVMLGMEYFLEICRDEALRADILACLRGQADTLLEKVGPGKFSITSTSMFWRGLNSSSVLEPIARLAGLTGDAKYRAFADHIVSCGGTAVGNIFELALADELLPYQYPMTKAYEMISCFEGLLEYVRIGGDEKWLSAAVRFADRILESDFTVIGGCGCTHELFDHSTVRQANTSNGTIMQETCVTVTLMKYLQRIHLLTGDAKYVDAFERALYNAYLGALNTEGVIEPSVAKDHPDWVLEPLPFDSYSPLTCGTRGNGIGGLKVMRGNHYYGCCACIGSAGIGLVPRIAALTAEDAVAMNLYIPGEISLSAPGGEALTLRTETAYPAAGDVRIILGLSAPTRFTFRLRIPVWSKATSLSVNGETVPVTAGYTAINRVWQPGDRVELELDMRTRILRPESYGTDILNTDYIWHLHYLTSRFDREDPDARKHFALQRGPLMLAREERLGLPVDTPVTVEDADGCVDVRPGTAPYPALVALEVPLADGTRMTVTDYASAGKLWRRESRMAVWMRGK